jgi:hypothetical protein
MTKTDPSPDHHLLGPHIDHLTKLLDEARRVYEAAEKAGVDVQLGHYRRIRLGQEMLQAISAMQPAPSHRERGT